MNNHACIKCGASYQDEDQDAYYCPACLEAKKALAAQLDAKRDALPTRLPRTSGLQEYEADPNKVHGFIRVTL